MFKSFAIITLLQVFALACETDLKMTVVHRPTLSEEYCLSNPQKYDCPNFMESVRKDKAFDLEEIGPVNSFEGQVVRLKGGSFDEHLQVTIEGQDVPLVKISDTEALFFTPSLASPGLKNATLKRLERSIEFKLFILADTSINPTSLGEPAQLCEGTEFMLSDGSIALGSKYCATMSPPLVNCSEDGEVGCITTNSFTATDIKSAANKILAGQRVGGVEGTFIAPSTGKVLSGTSYGVGGTGSMGTLTLPASAAVRSSAGAYGETGSTVTGTISDCAANDSDCYVPSYVLTTQPLKAISYDAIDAGKASIRSSLTLGGVTGTLANCADGDIGCYILGPNFKAAAVTGSSGDKILFGQTLAGYSGTVTLPLASKVLTGHSYGVGGNGLAGSLTVPAAGNVLSGSGTYGDALALITPTLTLPNSSKVLSGISFGVSGSTSSGALTLPSAGNVLAGSDSYGDSLSLTSPTYVCPSYVRPASPNITSINFNLTPDRVTVNWGAVSGAAGYIVIMRSNAAVTWTPTDGQSYTTGAQGSDTIIYSGTGTSVIYNTDVTAGITYSFAVYSYIANNIYSYLPSSSSMTSCAGLSGSWVAVPGDSTYGTSGFCVMKYEAKNVGGTATSEASGTPWVSISQTAAQDACSTLGANFHLITNDEWMSLASNIASVGSNWSGGSVGSGAMNRGHSDNSPAAACAALSDDSYAYVETDCTPLNSGIWSQKRTHTLSNGAVVWDLAGSVREWTSYVISNNSAKPYVSADGSPQTAWRELSAVNAGFTAMTLKELRPINAEKSFWSDSWNSTQGLGQYYTGSNGSGGALHRGANWSAGALGGIFSASLDQLPSHSISVQGFRCARVASP